MAKNYDELVDFAQGSDTGENNTDSIQPVGGGEFIANVVDNRPSENVRKRTERIRARLEELAYYADYDRSLLYRSDLGFEFQQVSSGGIFYRLNAFGGGDLWIYPALTPGRTSGGRFKGGRVFTTQGGNWVPYAGTPSVNDLILTCHSDYVGQRNYSDGPTFDGPSTAITLGANGIQVKLIADSGLAGGIGSISVVWSGVPKRKVTITYGSAAPATQLADLINFINSDLTSAGTYGLASLFRATTTGTLSNAPPSFTDGQVQGQYDSEAFQVTLAQLTAFFDITANQLQEGESLALGFPAGPVETGAGAKGGRRQSLWDLPTNRTGSKIQNTTPSVTTNLFNTGREPEKIPGSVPIGKMIQGRFVFSEGTVINPKGFGVGSAGDAAIKLGESADSIARYSSHTSHSQSGAFNIGYAPSAGIAWANTDLFNPANVAEAVDTIVANLAEISTDHSGSDRIGSDAIAGSASVGNSAASLSAGTLGSLLTALLNTAASNSTPGGVNYRLSEFGHQLHGKKPLFKDFRETSPVDISSGGAQLTKTILNPRGDVTAVGGYQSQAHLVLEPLLAGNINSVAGATFSQNMTITGFAIGGYTAVKLAGLSQTQFTAMFQKIPTLSSGGQNLGCIVCEISGLVQNAAPDGNGFYFYDSADKTVQMINLTRMSGQPLSNAQQANFHSADFTNAKITFYLPLIIGNTPGGHRIVSSLIGGTFAMIGVPRESDSFAGEQPIFEFIRAAKDPNSPGLLTGTIYNGRAVFREFSDIDVLGKTRDTSNILTLSDKNLLDGIETNNAVDATNNHHHGGTYTQTYFVDPSTIESEGGVDYDWSTWPSTSLADGQEIVTKVTAPYVPVGFTKVGTIVHIRINVTPAAIGMTTVDIRFGHAGFSIDVPPAYGCFTTAFYASTTAPRAFSVQLTLPVFTMGGNKSFVAWHDASNVAGGAQSLTITEVATILQRT